MIKLSNLVNEDLRKWFGKGGEGSSSGGGWDRYDSKGKKVGKCGDSKSGSAYAACLSKEKAAKLGADGRAAFVKRKRAAQKKAGDAKKGGEKSKGQKPTFVKTGASESVIENLNPNETEMVNGIVDMLRQIKDVKNRKQIALDRIEDFKKEGIIFDYNEFLKRCGLEPVKEDWSQKYKKSIDCNNPKGFSQRAHCQGRKKKNEMNNKMTIEERLNLFLEKNCPTDPGKWAASKSAAKSKFDVYPSAYANGWAAKNYKSKGGGWRKCK